MTEAPLWAPAPDEAAASQLARFARAIGLDDYDALHRSSVDEPEAFWAAVWEAGGIVGARGTRVLVDGDRMPGARFFPDASLNFAENLLRRADETDAIVAWDETGERRRLSWRALGEEVSRLQQLLVSSGVVAGEHVAAYLPNGPEAVVGMLAAASLGAVWSSCSPDFGERGALDRFGQIAPRVLLACDGYRYNGARIAVGDRVAAIAARLPSVERVLVADVLGGADALAARVPRAEPLARAAAAFAPAPLRFTRLPFAHPLYVLYSSGTTGAPKAIVHSAGGTLLQHVKEHRLHCDVRPGDRVLYFTTTGWMMWNWLVSALASEATILLYDGSPVAREGRILFDLAERERATLFGTSAKFLDATRKAGLRPRETHDLSPVRLIASTGSPLAPEGFDWVYDALTGRAQLASISGGTDIVSCFVLGVPTLPVWRGEIQRPGLGMAVDVWDERGRPLAAGAGELVCTRPFPSMPLGFWGDADGSRYRAAYFERFPGVWHHGDFAAWTAHGGIVILGRSDATLNPGGVRIGTAELYACVERMPEVAEALAVAQPWDGDSRIVLFVRLALGAALDDALTARIRRAIREGASPRHVPAKVVAVADIPRTKSGKISELAVRDVIAGRAVTNAEALANPEVLALYRDLEELRT